VLRQEYATEPSQRVDRKEIRPAGVPSASIIEHGVAWQEYGAMRYAYCALRRAEAERYRHSEGRDHGPAGYGFA